MGVVGGRGGGVLRGGVDVVERGGEVEEWGRVEGWGWGWRCEVGGRGEDVGGGWDGVGGEEEWVVARE